MGNRWKLLSRLSRSKREGHSKECSIEQNEDPEQITKCDSDSSGSVIEKTHVAYFCTQVPSNDESATYNTGNDDEKFRRSRECCSIVPSPFDSTCCGTGDIPEADSGEILKKRNFSHLMIQQQQVAKQVVETERDAVESIECIYGYKGDDTIELREDLPTIPLIGSQRDETPPNLCRCSSTRHQLPHLHPSQWPQGPLLLRPKPNGSTKILGIRKEGSDGSYLWKPGQTEPWWDVLQKEWCKTTPSSENRETSETSKATTTPKFCEYCVILPINNGCEEPQQSLVVDFETPLFEGTLLFRLRGTNGTTRDPHNEDTGYFASKAIRYQAVIRGRFKKQMRFSDLVTGTRLDRPCGKLPPKWIMWTAMKVVQFFAPQLNAQIEKCDKPYVLSALGSAPRTIVVEDISDDPNNVGESVMSREISEPETASQSLMGRDNHVENSLERTRVRKKQLDQWFMNQKEKPRARVDKVYTFEFLQHLFDYQHFHIEVSSSMHAKVKDLLDGQPLQLMAEYYKEGEEIDPDNKLWAFEIWNECLWDDAIAVLANSSSVIG